VTPIEGAGAASETLAGGVAAGARFFAVVESAGSLSQANPEAAVASISKANRIDHSSNRKTSTRTLQRASQSTWRATGPPLNTTSNWPKSASKSHQGRGYARHRAEFAPRRMQLLRWLMRAS
jgi:hypothetical protein